MDSLSTYEEQLKQVNLALSCLSEDEKDKEELNSLKVNLEQLIELTKETISPNNLSKTSEVNQEDEYALFLSEMEKEGALTASNKQTSNLESELKEIEGMKCRAPHEHQWGDVMYHNALICSVIPSKNYSCINDIRVKVMFINPTHEEMLPCPYLLDTSCKFDDDMCKYSHGETVLFSSLQEYVEPDYEHLTIGSKVLAKQKSKLWNRATIKRLLEDKCVVKFDSQPKEVELLLHEVLPLDKDEPQDHSSSGDESETEDNKNEIINVSLLNTPSSSVMGDWEKFTKGIGSKLMQKMGYIVGTGLGKTCSGRIDPVSAVVLPPGKSLDHCMNLREKSGGDKDLFSVERKLKKLQKKQEIRNKKAYEREKQKVDVFNFLNETLSKKNAEEEVHLKKSKHRNEIKSESGRSLNVAQMKVEKDIKQLDQEIWRIKESLKRHSDVRTQLNKNLRVKLDCKQFELKNLKAKAVNIANEQSLRRDKKKLTIF